MVSWRLYPEKQGLGKPRSLAHQSMFLHQGTITNPNLNIGEAQLQTPETEGGHVVTETHPPPCTLTAGGEIGAKYICGFSSGSPQLCCGCVKCERSLLPAVSQGHKKHTFFSQLLSGRLFSVQGDSLSLKGGDFSWKFREGGPAESHKQWLWKPAEFRYPLCIFIKHQQITSQAHCCTKTPPISSVNLTYG